MNKLLKIPSLLLLFTIITSFVNPPSPGFVVKTVVIDAGHGGHDYGCTGVNYKVKEKDVALAIALKLGKYIQETFKDVKVIYTRDTDVFIELNERAAIANKAKADLFICIHCNSACFDDPKTKKVKCKPEKNGTETYVMGLHKTEGNLMVAKRENASILLEKDYQKNYDGFDPGSDEASIVFTMYQSAFLENSIKFANNVQHEMNTYAGRVDREVRQAGFLVLWKTSMPSVLIETGYLTNPEEESFLRRKTKQEVVAFSIFKAFRSYKYDVEGKTLSKEEKEQKHSSTEKDDVTEDVKTEIKPEIKTNEPKKDSVIIEPVKDEPVVYVKPVVNNIVFKVQVLSSDKKIAVNSSSFKGLENINEFYSDGIYRYNVTEAYTIDDASKNLESIKTLGYKDAFVVAYNNGKKISVGEALSILKNKKIVQ